MSLSELGRFSEPALLILISLAGGEKHGYAMIEDIEAMTGVRLGAGTLYGALARLEEHGWIEPLPSQDRRKPYRLTPTGRNVAQETLDRMQRLSSLGSRRLEGVP